MNKTFGTHHLVDANNIIDNPMAIANHTSHVINATYNYWGTTDESEIAAMMWSGSDGSINFIPFVGDSRIIGDK